LYCLSTSSMCLFQMLISKHCQCAFTVVRCFWLLAVTGPIWLLFSWVSSFCRGRLHTLQYLSFTRFFILCYTSSLFITLFVILVWNSMHPVFSSRCRMSYIVLAGIPVFLLAFVSVSLALFLKYRSTCISFLLRV